MSVLPVDSTARGRLKIHSTYPMRQTRTAHAEKTVRAGSTRLSQATGKRNGG